MHIALDAQLIHTGATFRSAGVSAYSFNLLRALGAERLAGRTGHDFTAYVNAPELALSGVTLVQSRLPLARPIARIGWEQTIFPLALGNAALVHGLVNVLPLAARSAGVVTVHDLAFVRTPAALPRVKRAYLTALCRASVARAAHVIAVSTQTADDLMALFGTPAHKITVVPNGVGTEFAAGRSDDVARFRAAHGLPDRFLLFVGTLEPRKNLAALVRAYARWRTQAAPDDREIKLVLAGGKGWFYDQIFAQVQALGLENAVLFPGYVPAADLPHFYQAALGFVYPSLLEGFGLPVLEAMASGAPVITSRAPSLMEVAGDAALCVEAGDEAALAHAIGLLATQAALRDALRTRGLARAAQFSWQRTARETLAVYDTVT